MPRGLPNLILPRTDVERYLCVQIEKGKGLYAYELSTNGLCEVEQKYRVWNDDNQGLLKESFDRQEIAEEYDSVRGWEDGGTDDFSRMKNHEEKLREKIRWLEGFLNRLNQYEEVLAQPTNLVQQPVKVSTANGRVFIGHGRSQTWRDLKDFLQDRLRLRYDEFNREPSAGKSTKERLSEMLNNASFAFLVLTAEDEHADKSEHARENVIHEAGLFQGKLGFERAIILLEEGCSEFGNIMGLVQIRFPHGDIPAIFEEIRRVLERESVIPR